MTHLESIILPRAAAQPISPQAGIALAQLEGDATLLTERARRRFEFPASVPFALDVHWPTETSRGELRGLGAIRVDARRAVNLRFGVELETLTVVRAAGKSTVTLSLLAGSDEPRPAISARALVSPPEDDDPLLAALQGRHPLDWMRSLLHGVGSPAWALMAREASVWPEHLDRLLELWRQLPAGAEHALWRCANDTAGLAKLGAWGTRLDAGMSSVGAAAEVRTALAGGMDWASSPAAEWLESSSGLPLCLLDTPRAAYLLKTAGSLLGGILELGLTSTVLESFRDMAEASLGQDRLSAASAAWMRERGNRRDTLQRLCGAIYAEAQSGLGDTAAGSLARMIEGAGGSWPLAEASFDLAQPGAVEQFHAALAGDLDSFSASRNGVRPAPSIFALCAARPLALSVSLPLTTRRRAARMLAHLEKAGVTSLPGGHIEVRVPPERACHLGDCDQSVLERVALAPLRANTREPGASENEMSCEVSFREGDDTPSITRQRLLSWLGLPENLPDEQMEARIRLSIPAGWSEIWHELPHSRDGVFQAVFGSISTSLQASMRRWLPFFALSDPDCYAEPIVALPLLAYANSAPFRGIRKGEFTYSRRGTLGVRVALQSAMRGMPETLAAVHRQLVAAGHRSHRSYEPWKSRTVSSTVYRQRRHFMQLLAADSFFVEEILHLSDSARELRSLQGSPQLATKLLFKSIQSSSLGLAKHIRKLYDERVFDALPSILWIEATAAACRAMGAEAHVAATLTLHRREGVEIRHNAAALGRS